MPSKTLRKLISSACILQTAIQGGFLLGAGHAPALAASGDAVMAEPPIHGAHKAQPAESGPEESAPAAPQRDWSAPTLTNLAREYKATPDDLTFGRYFAYLRDMLVAPDFAAANPAEIIAANPSLTEMHVKVTDLGVKGMHLWSFPYANESHTVIFACPGKTTAIPLPLSIVLREGRIIPSAMAASASGTARVVVKLKGKKGQIVKVVKTVKTARPHPAPAEAAAPSLSAFGKYLVLIGGDRQSNGLWLKGFKLGEGPLVEAPELFSSLPLFFSQNVTGKASFSGSDIVLAVQPPANAQAAREEAEKAEVIIQSNGKPLPVKPVPTAVAGYKVVLRYMGGKYALAGHVPDDAPLSIALAFAQNITAGKADIAKAWLADPKLISIPKYLGLIGRSSPPMHLVAMSGASGARYRLVTGATDDLIIDVGRILTPGVRRGQLAVKGLFVAPPDPYAVKFASTPVLPKEEEPRSAEEGVEGKATGKPNGDAAKSGAKKNPRPAASVTKSGGKAGRAH